jgi:predicted nuclease of predicted toxin-antitoxin system
MRILADECMGAHVIRRLRDDGHAVDYIAESAPSLSDEAVLKFSFEGTLLLLTRDKDFGELVFREHRGHVGVVLVRLAQFSAAMESETVSHCLLTYGDTLLTRFTVITPSGIRMHHVLGQ